MAGAYEAMSKGCPSKKVLIRYFSRAAHALRLGKFHQNLQVSFLIQDLNSRKILALYVAMKHQVWWLLNKTFSLIVTFTGGILCRDGIFLFEDHSQLAEDNRSGNKDACH